jgi:hypothetical protein
MRMICDKCDKYYDDEFHSTLCPHNGIGFCRKCDCYVCVCTPSLKEGNRYDERTATHPATRSGS